MMYSDVRDLGYGQDYVYTGHYTAKDETEEDYDVMAVFDGHGGQRSNASEHCISRLRDADMANLLHQRNPINAIIEYLRERQYHYLRITGSTCSVARIYPKSRRIECYNVGDSQTFIFLDGKMEYVNRPHNPTNTFELARLDKLYGRGRYTFSNMSWRTETLSSTEITMVPAQHLRFPSGLQLSPTQSLGHHDETGYDIEAYICNYNENQCVKVVVVSDGVTDMLSLCDPNDLSILCNLNANEIADVVDGRWHQTWRQVWRKKADSYLPRADTWHKEALAEVSFIETKFPENSYDDIGVATWTNRV